MNTNNSTAKSDLISVCAVLGMWLLSCYLVDRFPGFERFVDMFFA